MRKDGFAALSRYGGATTGSADFTDQVLNRRKQRHEDYGPFVAIHRTALYSLRYLLFGKVRSRCLPFDFAQGKVGGALLDPCYQCNPWLIPFRREGGDDFFEAGFPRANGYFLTWETPGELFQLS
jgi:hypothetical protein